MYAFYIGGETSCGACLQHDTTLRIGFLSLEEGGALPLHHFRTDASVIERAAFEYPHPSGNRRRPFGFHCGATLSARPKISQLLVCAKNHEAYIQNFLRCLWVRYISNGAVTLDVREQRSFGWVRRYEPMSLLDLRNPMLPNLAPAACSVRIVPCPISHHGCALTANAPTARRGSSGGAGNRPGSSPAGKACLALGRDKWSSVGAWW